MLGWLRDKLGSKHPLEEDFRTLVGPALTPRVLAYLQTGQDEAVFDAIPRFQLTKSSARERFLADLEKHDPHVVRRLARIYAAGTEVEWMEALLTAALRVNPNHHPRRAEGKVEVGALHRLFDHPDDLYRHYLAIPWSKPFPAQQLLMVRGFLDDFARHPEAFREALGKNPRRALETLAEFSLPVEPVLHELLSLLSSSTKVVRELATSLLKYHPEALCEHLPQLAPGDRIEALRSLAGWGRRDLLEAWQAQETSDNVLAALEGLLPPPVELPPAPSLASLDLDVPLHPVVCEAIRSILEATREGPKWQRIDPKIAGKLCDALETGRLGPGHKALLHPSGIHVLAPVFDLPELTLPQAVRLAFHTSYQQPSTLPVALAALITRYRRRRTPRTTLLDLAAVLEALGEPSDLLTSCALNCWWGSDITKWEDEAVWPYFATRVEPVVRALQNRSNDYKTAGIRQRALEIVARFPVPPTLLQEELYYLAFNTARPQAVQAMLTRVPGFEERVVASLSDGKQEVRTAAAQWLARLRLPEAEAALRKALAKEKQELARAAMLTALESLGVPLQEFLNRELLAKEAAKCAIPEGLSWFPFDQLPPLQWHTGEPVDPAIPTFWVVRAHKLKVPEANPLLRLYCQQLADAQPLGRHVLGAWLARDSAAGSAVADKGLLALAGACGGGELVRASEHYLKTWYGQRAAQCKALLAMLASTGEPLALQLVLGVASRFRTKGIQDEANRQAQLLAERRGWTIAELADRSVPTGGFDPDGRLVLGAGTARVLPDFSIEAPAGLSAEDKKALATARKELKSVQKLQKERLYEAMCTQRGWSYEDWRLFLWEHPLLRHLCGRLVWAVDGGPVSFRPLADGTLSDVEDNDVEPGPAARITVAHQSLVSPAWLQHLADYEVEPLFLQFGRDVYELPEERRDDEAIGDFEGHMLEAFRLRSRALALGYVRGPSEDGGWFRCYRKSFPELSLEVQLGFSGNALPEENRQVALEKLSFESGRQLALGEVPPILLSECYRDLATIAAEGSGFNPNWARIVA